MAYSTMHRELLIEEIDAADAAKLDAIRADLIGGGFAEDGLMVGLIDRRKAVLEPAPSPDEKELRMAALEHQRGVAMYGRRGWLAIERGSREGATEDERATRERLMEQYRSNLKTARAAVARRAGKEG